MRLRTFLIGTLTAFAVISCGGGGTNTAGGIGGTGVSYGPVTGFGSVIVNGVEYQTGSASFTKDGVSTTQAGLGVGMLVSVTNDGSGNAKSVSFSDNVQGPVSSIGANDFVVLGLDVQVNGLTVYAGGLTALTDINTRDIVEVSGHITGTATVLATRVEKLAMTCPLSSGQEIEVKGAASNINTVADTFDIGTLTVNANGHMPANLTAGDYVEVKSNACPSGNVLTANAVETATEGPNLSELDHQNQGELEIKGIAALQSGSGTNCVYTVNGQDVNTNTNTTLDGVAIAACETLDGKLVEAQGQLSGTTLVASEIKNEDSETTTTNHYLGTVVVDSQTSSLAGSIHVDDAGGANISGSTPITVDLNTQFEGENDSQSFNLDAMAATPTCAEVEVDANNHAISIHQESSCP
jgi:hypothetical protein